MRIVSLLPSATEMVCELGLGSELVGVTHECDYPPDVKRLPKVTQTLIPVDATSREIDQLVRERLQDQRALYSLDFPTLKSLEPDLLITQTLCDVCAVAEAEVNEAVCQLPGHPRILNLEPTRLSEVFDGLLMIGEAANADSRARDAVDRLQTRIDAVRGRSNALKHRKRVVLLEWIDPPFSSGHWSPELVWLAGGVELIGGEGRPSRTIEWREVIAADPDVMIIACCGFDIERTRADLPVLAAFPGFQQLACVRSGQIYLMDGNAYFSRPGPRLVESLEVLAHVLHPDHHPHPPGVPGAERLEMINLLPPVSAS